MFGAGLVEVDFPLRAGLDDKGAGAVGADAVTVVDAALGQLCDGLWACQ